jgi:hypothetical protein
MIFGSNSNIQNMKMDNVKKKIEFLFQEEKRL